MSIYQDVSLQQLNLRFREDSSFDDKDEHTGGE